MLTRYDLLSTEKLIELYADEQTRINRDDAELTQTLIRKALMRRFKQVLRMLDDEQTAKNPRGTFSILLGRCSK